MNIDQELSTLMDILRPNRKAERRFAQERILEELYRILMYLNNYSFDLATKESEEVLKVLQQNYASTIIKSSVEAMQILMVTMIHDENLKKFGFQNVDLIKESYRLEIFCLVFMAACFFEMVSILEEEEEKEGTGK